MLSRQADDSRVHGLTRLLGVKRTVNTADADPSYGQVAIV